MWFSRMLLPALLLASLALCLLLLSPYLHAIILAILVASLFHPLYRWLEARTGRHCNLSALAAVVIVCLVLLVPTALFAGALMRQALETVQAAHGWIADGRLEAAVRTVNVAEFLDRPYLRPFRPALEAWAGLGDDQKLDVSNARIAELLASVGFFLLNRLGGMVHPALTGGGRFLLGFGVMLFVLFFAFRDGAKVLDQVRRLVPLRRSHEEALLQRIRDVSRAVLLGTVVTALAQGAMGMIGLRIVGVPALFWGTLLGASSIVPVVGTALIWVPCVGYLALCGRFGAAAFLSLWCIMVVGTIDNLLRPFLLGGKTGMSAAVAFLSIIGGIHVFGPVGVIYGPLIFGLCAVCLYIYELENATLLQRQQRL